MYPGQELNNLALHRRILHRRIARHRVECRAAAAQLGRPIAWLDRAVALWRRLPPLVQIGVPSLGALFAGRLFRGHKVLGRLLRWGPVVAGVVRTLTSAGARR